MCVNASNSKAVHTADVTQVRCNSSIRVARCVPPQLSVTWWWTLNPGVWILVTYSALDWHAQYVYDYAQCIMKGLGMQVAMQMRRWANVQWDWMSLSFWTLFRHGQHVICLFSTSRHDILHYSQLIAHDKMCKRSLRCSVQLESRPIHWNKGQQHHSLFELSAYLPSVRCLCWGKKK